MFKLATALALATAALAGSPALAADAAPVTPQVASARVVTADLDLSGRAGIRALDRRLAIAINTVCPAPFGADLRGTLDHKTCLYTAKRSAREARARLLAPTDIAPVQLAAGAR